MEYRIKCYKIIEDVPIHQLLIKNEKKDKHSFFWIYKSMWQDCIDIGRSKGVCVISYQGGLVAFCTCTNSNVFSGSKVQWRGAEMMSSHLRMIINELKCYDADELWCQSITLLSRSQSAIIMTNTEKDVEVWGIIYGDYCIYDKSKRKRKLKLNLLQNSTL